MSGATRVRISPLAGKPAPAGSLVDMPRLITAYYSERPDPACRAQRVAFGTSGHRGSSFDAQLQRMARARDQPGDLRLPQAQGHRRAAVPRLRHACAVGARRSRARSRCWRPMASRSMIAAGDEYTPTPAISHAILAYNRGRTHRPRRRHRHHAVAQSARQRRLQVQPAERRAGRHRHHRLDRSPRERAAAERPRRRAAHSATRRRGAPRRRTATTFSAPMSRDLGNVIDMDAIRAAGLAPGRRSARRRRRALLGRASPSTTGSNLTVVNEDVDPTFRFMTLDWDGKIRMDPSSLVRDAAPDRAEGPLRRRLRLRYRPRPARHRHARARDCCRRTITSRSRSTTCSSTGRSGGKRRGGRQDGGQQPDDRPGRGEARPAAATRCRSVSSGSSTACSTARSASAARRAPAPRSSAATAASGPPTRTA